MFKKYLEVSSIVIVVLVLIVLSYFKFINYTFEKKELEKREKVETIIENKSQENFTINLIKSHFGSSVYLEKDTKMYVIENSVPKEIGIIYKDTIINLDKNQEIMADTKYFKLENLEYYIEYKNALPCDNNYVKNVDFKNYIPFDENVITYNITNFYDENDKKVIVLNKSIDLPVIIKDNSKYYVDYGNKLYYIRAEESKLEKKRSNDKVLATNIATVAYHFFYDASKGDNCNQIICLSNTKFDEQMKYLKDNNYYTATMHSFELWLDKKIRLPKNTVVLTIDDGYNVEEGIKVLEKYGLHATLFLVTSWNLPEKYKTNVLEYHSHSHNMHNTGVCPNGQGGGIQCLPHDEILSDLKKSQDLLNGSFVFCYPFYEYNEYSISVLKEAGYRMAFGGNRVKTYQGYNKFKLPRYTILSDDTLQSFINYIR